MNQKKWLLIGLGVVAVLVGGFFLLNSYIYEQKQPYAAAHYKNAEYMIDGQRLRLKDGSAESEVAPGSAARISTRYFGNELKTDLDGDGREDVVFLLTQSGGGSGTFFYVVAARNTERGYVGSEALFLGDRIAPQTTEVSQNPVHKNVIVVNYADRKPGEAMTVQPSVGKSIWLKLDPQTMQFGEVAQNFEGEADPSRMTVSMKKWIWVSALSNDGREIKPAKTEAFTLTFGTDGRFSATTDCNLMSGDYTATSDMLSFGSIASTKMFCAGSQEEEFATLLQNTDGYHLTSRGELILHLKFDSGTVTFR